MIPSILNKTPDIFGLKGNDLESIIAVLQQHDDVEEAIIFGSRAKGNFKNGSDVDIVLKGSGISHGVVRNIGYLLNEETQMPYKFDIINYHTIANAGLREHVTRVGVSFYKRN